MITSESTKAIDAAILQFQGHVDGVKRDAQNPHFKSRYATLENVIDTARPVLQSCGITFMQFPGAVVDGCLEVTTRLAHAESGEWIAGTMHMPLGKRDPQGTGSAQTYAMRYSLMALLGLPPTDDDAEGATERNDPPKRQVGWNAAGTARTAHSLKKEGVWDEMRREIEECQTTERLMKLRLAWSAKAQDDKWPQSWKDIASEEFDKARQILEGTFPGDITINGKTLNAMDAG